MAPTSRGVRSWRPERWIASTVTAANPFPIPDEGQSYLALRGLSLTFKQALELRDPAEPIIFHFHARDADVRRHRVRFPGHRFGKDEAYYFLPAPKGAVPYTHVGLHPGVTRRILAEAIAAGNGRLLDLSPEGCTQKRCTQASPVWTRP